MGDNNNAAWKRELRIVLELLRAWSKYQPPMKSRVPGNRADNQRALYQPAFNWATVVKQQAEFEAAAADGRLGKDAFAIGGYLNVTPVGVGKPHLFPIVTVGLRLRDGRLELALRVVTFYVDECFGWVDAHGWRLDMADPMPADGEEPGPRHHRFPHVQRITGWLPSQPTFFPPGVPSANKPDQYGENMSGPSMNESRPAFPLPVKSAGGIVVAAMAALYGAPTALAIIGNVERPSKTLRSEAETILGHG